MRPRATSGWRSPRRRSPSKQKVAKSSELVITVRNARVGQDRAQRGRDRERASTRKVDNPDLADPSRPVFVVNGEPMNVGGLPGAKGADARGRRDRLREHLGARPAAPGQEKTFRWSVTAVRPGPYDVKLHGGGVAERQGQGRGPGRPGPHRLVQGHGRALHPQRPHRTDDGKTVVTALAPSRPRLAERSKPPHSRRPAGADTSGTPDPSASAHTSRTSCRACCGRPAGDGSVAQPGAHGTKYLSAAPATGGRGAQGGGSRSEAAGRAGGRLVREVLPVASMASPRTPAAAGARGRPTRYLMNSISAYFGSGHRSSATIFSSRSPSSRTLAIAVIWLSRA